MDWAERCAELTDAEFRRTYRMDKSAFRHLLEVLAPSLSGDVPMAVRSSGSAVAPALQLSMTLRYLAGGSYLDITQMHGVHTSTMFACVHRVIKAINDAPELRITFPADDPGALADLAAGFSRSRDYHADRLPGCVGALDGIALQIKRPVACPTARSFYNRKGFFAYAAQGMCDSRYRFTYWSCLCAGSTHDSLAFDASSLGHYLQAHGLPAPYWIAGDEAYAAKDWLLTPWPGRRASPEQDAFNYHLSSQRIHIEQAFGILVARWGILWRPLTGDYRDVPKLTLALVKLHNWCLDHGDRTPRARLARDRRPGDNAGDVVHQDECDRDAAQHRRRRDLERSDKRKHLTDYLRDRQARRPQSYPARSNQRAAHIR
jgi:hypothetical protein